MNEVILVYPRLGSMDAMVVDPPLSVLYAAADCVKMGVKVKVIDLRGERNYKKIISQAITPETKLIGLSVMTGNPLKYAKMVSQHVREKHPQVKIVWGGPHVTVVPETIEEDFIDFLIRGYGSVSLYKLYKAQFDGKLDGIEGLSYKSEGQVIHNQRSDTFEVLSYQEIPYDLVDMNSTKYMRNYNQKRIFPLFSTIGCPYRCNFCVHPAIYEEINGAKWQTYDTSEVVGHIKMAIQKYQANHFVFFDDTSFRSLKHMRELFEKLVNENLGVTLEFRGCRINELREMDDDFLNLLVAAGGRVIQVGVESGSNRVLKEMQKGISAELVIEQNKKLARFPQIKCMYNFLYGMPGETYEDLLATKNLAMQIVKDNPQSYMGFGGDWKPIPGTKALTNAMKYGDFKAPKTLEDWIEIDSSDSHQKLVHPWYSWKQNQLIKVLQITSFIIDNKLIKETEGNNQPFFVFVRLLSRIYRPIGLFRLKFNFNYLMVEYEIFTVFLRLLGKFGNHKSQKDEGSSNDSNNQALEKCA